jgi:hypothetical protein
MSGECVLDHDDMSAVVFEHVALAERPEQRSAGGHATTGAAD